MSFYYRKMPIIVCMKIKKINNLINYSMNSHHEGLCEG